MGKGRSQRSEDLLTELEGYRASLHASLQSMADRNAANREMINRMSAVLDKACESAQKLKE